MRSHYVGNTQVGRQKTPQSDNDQGYIFKPSGRAEKEKIRKSQREMTGVRDATKFSVARLGEISSLCQDFISFWLMFRLGI